MGLTDTRSWKTIRLQAGGSVNVWAALEPEVSLNLEFSEIMDSFSYCAVLSTTLRFTQS